MQFVVLLGNKAVIRINSSKQYLFSWEIVFFLNKYSIITISITNYKIVWPIFKMSRSKTSVTITE